MQSITKEKNYIPFKDLSDIPDKNWLPDGETFTYKGKLYRLNPDFSITEVKPCKE
jgi:hypothetical protein